VPGVAGSTASPPDRRVGVLVSGSGTNLQALLDDPAIGPHVVVVISDRPGVRALDRAAAAGVESVVVDPADHGDREAHTKAMVTELDARGVDVVVSAGYMRILGPEAVERWRGRFLNVHPALLPAFPGMHGVDDALAAGVKITGVTVHLVDEGVDSGPVVCQEAVEIRDDDTWDSLEERIHAAEHRQLPKAVRALMEGRLRMEGRKVTIAEPTS
jgi:phosphoribosylglycinamide formyltransferase-1